ncbi:fimbria/pilus outer membrane usher protein [Enterobacter hormaechei]|uniref:fimbria/pilus outer membrane usher protein n=1 Tax=Enterobacter cloacae complex TaxID=354276 RepID=UPI0022F0FE8E|nr:fimbria/pilus outer membrane usher protein [Enterobacter hormaechei]MDA4645165.1 fimbria/pilus outer membrane usher protein [Enterobacter hormaechei]MDA4840918.1 fimbria/pilus outer membrane usher protein [Enterobacter hormaechei]
MAIDARQLKPAMMILLCVSTSAFAETGDDSLPPPDARTMNGEAVFQLALVLNHYDTGLVVPVTQREGAWFISGADLLRAGLPQEHVPAGEVNLSTLSSVRVEYDSSAQRLMLTVPRDWVAARITSFSGQSAQSKPHYGRGALLNYDVYTNHTEHTGGQASVWHEFRYFNEDYSFSSTGYARQNFAGSSGQQEGYVRYDSTLLITNEEDATTWTVGDVISDALSWSTSVRMGGISYGRDFSLRPDLVTWPLPAFSGEAAVPTSIDLFINGYRSGSTRLQPGPFTLTNLPYINGAGDAVLVTTDALGRQVSTTLPFYVSSDLLKQGLSDGAVTLGSLRRNYGIENFDYGPAAGSGSYRYGVTDWLTLEGHAEGAESLALGGAGTVLKLGRFGVVNTSYTQSRMRGDEGGQMNWGYQYSTSEFSVATQHTRRDRGFGNLALYDQPTVYDEYDNPVASLSRNTDQYSLTFNLGDYGNIGAAWIGVESFDSRKTELLNLSWSRNLWRSSSIYLAASRDQQRDDWTVALSLQVPLGERDSAAVTFENTPDAGSTQRINYNHSMPSDGGFSWNMAWANQSRSSNYQQATLGWRNNNVELQGGGYGEKGMMTWWGEAMGSVVLMDGELFAANKINDAFVVISTDGHPDVPVSYENQPVGKTNNKGYLLVSGVSAYYPASYRIDTLNLPADTRLKETERRVAIRRHNGYLVDFPMEQERVASVILHDAQGNPIPVGSQVKRASRSSAVVGYDGLAWLENLNDVNPLEVITPDGKRCIATLNVGANPEHKLQTYGPLTCREAP